MDRRLIAVSRCGLQPALKTTAIDRKGSRWYSAAMWRAVRLSLAVLLFSLPSFGQVKATGPSLEDTFKWMDQTYNGGRRGLFQQSTRDGKLYVAYLEDFTYTQCSISHTVKELPDSKGAKYVRTQSNVEVFNLRDIDPTTVKVIPFDSTAGTSCLDPDEVKRSKLSCDGQAEVRFSTRNEAPKINYHSVTIFPGIPENKPNHKLDQTGTQSYAAFSMYDTAYAKRFAKAFSHAVELCGGTRSFLDLRTPARGLIAD
jgi:hypothetical protein